MLLNLSIHEHSMVELHQALQQGLEATTFAGQTPKPPLKAATLHCDRNWWALDRVGLQPETT